MMSPRLDSAGGSLLSRVARLRTRTVAMPLAVGLDLAFGEPPSWAHPVVWIGTSITTLERLAPSGPAGRLVFGAGMTALVVGGSALFGSLVGRLADRLPSGLGLVVEAYALKTMLSVRALLEAGRSVDRCLDRDDLDGAREAARALVSRDVRQLDRNLLASAAIESLAENTSDSIVAPLCYYALGGLPAVFAYRAANTLDAMIGYRGEYEHLGKAAARLDDLLNLLPARLTSAVLLAAGALGGGDIGTGISITRRDHGTTASPNAGWPMSTIAGLLGTRLEKPDHYVIGGDLPPPDLPAIDHAAELVKTAAILTIPVTLGLRHILGGLYDRVMRSRPEAVR